MVTFSLPFVPLMRARVVAIVLFRLQALIVLLLSLIVSSVALLFPLWSWSVPIWMMVMMIRNQGPNRDWFISCEPEDKEEGATTDPAKPKKEARDRGKT